MFTAPTLTTTLSQSQASLQIYQVVEAIARYKQPAFHINSASLTGEHAEPTRIGSLLLNFNSLLNVFADHYDYSEHLLAFSQACQDIGLERGFQAVTCLDETGTHYLDFPRTMNRLVARIRELTQTPAFKRKAADRHYQSAMSTARLEEYTRNVLAKYSRTEVLRIDLYYNLFTQPRLRIEHVYEDLRALIRARERNPIFAHETGYIWSVEQGGTTGSFHIHAAFFFNSAHVQSYWDKGLKIEELWEQITRGGGYAHICRREDYSEPGVGTILRSDPVACEHVIKAMRYLAKNDQHLQVRPLGARSIGTGMLF
ncbi:TPA: inovirus-type Gp2 protein [Pseudomonas aeruginosa]|uniref:YagK/YfjJ domain-containing protein n=1 Tax=Pseudomonas aeruginosa TaxID=287 RepID=UPI0018C79A97|nr:inovirus-type Gp2 protein [Pseudomonas aeruginosa]EKI2989569.1 inovirus-type Gp2 protein [Pseudomonas aeruginosa]EKV5566711.1 inovirus-type Gp2 protein [Pseudomonas aeruginosa]ELJ2627141.1 inovirus-type Gp2 protein [Pseudomonas aeruginosa]MBG4963581.1 inovirus-type Gp2 protein [Pseudomonas aeruginosa]MBH8631195.1 inovirus-type Gp2 protein [Pseudomonas aeruginosa]